MINVKVSWLTPKSVSIIWEEIPSETAASYSGHFYVAQRSNAKNGEFYNLGSPVLPSSTLSLIDADLPTENRNDVFFYRIQRRAANGDILKTSSVENPRRERPYIALEIIRRTNLLLRRLSGIRAFLFTKSSSGERCSSCWDPIKERKTKSHCPICLGEDYVGGYSQATPILILQNSSSISKVVDITGSMENIASNFVTSNYPPIKPGDLIVLDSFRFYRVDNVSAINFRDVTVVQALGMSSLEKGREISNLTIPSFSEFDEMDLIHRQYGGLSGDTLDKTIDNKLVHGEFYIDKEGYAK